MIGSINYETNCTAYILTSEILIPLMEADFHKQFSLKLIILLLKKTIHQKMKPKD